VEKLIAEAHTQVIRARDYIQSQEKHADFSLARGETLRVDRERYNEIFLITVTLENLDVYTTMLHETADMDVFGSEELPWSVSFFDLKVICDCTEFPAQLPHYLHRRLRLNQIRKIHTHDELDWFGIYLKYGLYFEDSKETEEYDMIFYDNFTEIFDKWYLYEAGVLDKAYSKPAMLMSKRYRQMIYEISSENTYRNSDVIGLLLDLSGDARKELEDKIKLTVSNARRDGKMHNAVMSFGKGESVILFYSVPLWQRDEMQPRFEAHCNLRKYACKAGSCLGIINFMDQPKRIVHGWLFSSEPWEFDEEMDMRVKEMGIHN